MTNYFRSFRKENKGNETKLGNNEGIKTGKTQWMDDKAVAACFECKIEFSFFVRRHHCRACGRIFCDRCSRQRAVVNGRVQRVCDHCYEQREEKRSKYPTVELENNEVVSRTDTRILTSENFDDSKRGSASALDEAGAKDALKAAEREIVLTDLNHETNFRLPSATLEDETYKTKYNWFESDLTTNSTLRRSIRVDSLNQSESNSEASDATARENSKPAAPSVLVRHDSTYEHFESEDCAVDGSKENIWWTSQSPENKDALSLNEDFNVKLRRQRVKDAADVHFASLISFLVASEGLNLDWKDSISLLSTEAYEKVRMASGDFRDIRKYVKVKKVSGGAIWESAILRGITFTRNVAHKRMRDDIEDPRLLLLGCSIEYERENKFSTLANFACQEREYLRIAVNRILAQKPDVVLVEKSVAGVAQLMLLEANVTVVLNVKRAVLEKIARSTGAYIVPSLELLGASGKPAAQQRTHRQQEDSCNQIVESGRFRAIAQLGQNKPLINIDVSKHWSGPTCCTVVIRGDSAASLVRVKALLLYAMYARQCISTEVAFLHSCGAQVPPDFKLIRDHFAAKEFHNAADSGSDGEDTEVAASASRRSSESALTARVPVGEKAPDEGTAEAEFRVLHLSPFFAFKLPQECSRWLHRVVHQRRTAEILQCLTDAPDADGVSSVRDGSEGGSDITEGRRELCDAFTIHEIGGRSDDGKPHHRLSIISAERVLALAPAQGLLWTAPGISLDSATMDTLRVLGSSAVPGGDGAACIEPSEVWIRFQGDGDSSIGEYLRSYCFNPHAHCPAKGCGLPMHEHEHTFVHGAARVRIRVSQRASQPASRAGEIVHRMRCVTCARMTSSGTLLSEAALRLSFGRFLQSLLYDRSVLTDDPACLHPFHEQLHSFSQGSMTALFMTEPVTLFEVILPSLRMEPVPEDLEPRLALLELTEVEVATERLVGLAESLGGDAPRVAQAQVDALAAVCRAAAEQGVTLEQAASLRRALFQAVEQCLAEAPLGSAQPSNNDPASTHGESDAGVMEQIMQPAISVTPAGCAGDMVRRQEHGESDSDSSEEDPATGSNEAQPSDPLSSSPLEGSLQLPWPQIKDLRPTPPSAAAAAAAAAATSSIALAPNPLTLARLLTGGGGRRWGRVSQDQVQAHLEGSLLSTAIGHCCHVAVSQATISKTSSGGGGGGGGGFIVSTAGPAVYEDDPSSIIAYALTSQAYADALAKMQSAHASAGTSMPGSGRDAAVGDVQERLHLKLAMESDGLAGRVQLRCKVYLARQFAALRQRYCGGEGGERAFVKALLRCRKWAPTGGKSCAGFVKTVDGRFILKDLARSELRHLLSSADAYFDYITRTLGPDTTRDDSGGAALPSCLVKVLGVFKAEWRHVRSGRHTVHSVIVMENLWYTGGRLSRPVTRIFDLKGSARNRFVKEAKEGDVQLDDNFHEYLQRSPLLLAEGGKRLLSASVFNDTVFLTAFNVMDYSLLVGVDEAAGRLVVGIIDYMRPYTMDKQAEFYYKSAMDRVALKATYDAPTVIPPPEYRQRFRQAMSRDFLASPSKLSVLRQPRDPMNKSGPGLGFAV